MPSNMKMTHFKFPNPTLGLSEREEMRRRHSRRSLKSTGSSSDTQDSPPINSPSPETSPQIAKSIVNFRRCYSMQGASHEFIEAKLKSAVDELLDFLVSEEFNSRDLERVLYDRKWKEPQMPLILDWCISFIDSLSQQRRIPSPNPPHNVRLSKSRLAIAWSPPLSRKEKELLVALQVARQRLEKFKAPSSSTASDESHPIMLALQAATENLLELRSQQAAQVC